jgi:hypothetical protein
MDRFADFLKERVYLLNVSPATVTYYQCGFKAWTRHADESQDPKQWIVISGSGMRLRSKLPAPCGASIEIKVNDTVARGKVCRCQEKPDTALQDFYRASYYISDFPNGTEVAER